jgi:hypothetical protein
MRKIIGLSLAGVLAGCAGMQGADTSFPTDYREIIARNQTTLFKDPGSVQDAQIGVPKSSMWGWQVCLKANAKNGFGGYTGQTMYTVQLYKNGNPPILLPSTIYDGCGSDYFVPFHEIEGGYVAPVPTPPPANKKPGA